MHALARDPLSEFVMTLARQTAIRKIGGMGAVANRIAKRPDSHAITGGALAVPQTERSGSESKPAGAATNGGWAMGGERFRKEIEAAARRRAAPLPPGPKPAAAHDTRQMRPL